MDSSLSRRGFRCALFRSTALSACGLLLALVSMPAGQVGTVQSEQKISATSGGGVLDPSAGYFGTSVASLGDLDGDGIGDLAVGNVGVDGLGINQGAVWMLFLDADGTVKSRRKIGAGSAGFGGDLDSFDLFGYSVANLGDLDGDGVVDLAVGAPGDDDGDADQGALWILFLNADGTVKAEQKISATAGGFGGALDAQDQLGFSLATLGDLDDDGVVDLAAGAYQDDDGGLSAGAEWILFLNADGTVEAEQKISATAGGFGGMLEPADLFGISAAALGDLDGDGIEDLAVGAARDDDGGMNQGAVWVLFLNANGTVKAEQKISETAGGFGGILNAFDYFASSLSSLGDLDRDGIVDLAVGAEWDGAADRGAVWILFLNDDGTVKARQKINAGTGGFGGSLDPNDKFGAAVACAGDLDGDGVVELAVGAPFDDDGADDQGAVWVLFLEGPCVLLDFEHEDDLATPLVNGQHIDTEFGGFVTLTSSGPNAGLAIFDSTPGGPNDPSQDRDLLAGTGNVLILQTENYPPDGNDLFPRPNDDEDGGTMAFAFASAVSPASVRLIDLDAGDGTTRVVLTDGAGKQRTYTVPGNWTGDLLLAQPGQGVLDLTTLADQPGFGSTATAAEQAGFDGEHVLGLAVHLNGSGAVDDLCVCSASFLRAAVRVRNGAAGNPRTLSAASLPVLGSAFRAELDCSLLGQGFAVVAIRRQAHAGTMTPFGELLIAGTLVTQTTRVFAGGPSQITWNVPQDLTLLGLDLHVQGFCSGAPGPARGKTRAARGRLSNALDLTLGF